MGMTTDAGTELAFARLFPRLLDAAGEAIIALGPAGNVTYANLAAERMCGWDAGERPSSLLDAGHLPAESVESASELRQRMLDGQVWSGRLELQRRGGSRFHARVTATPVTDHGVLTNILIVASDSSEREAAEECFAHHESWLTCHDVTGQLVLSAALKERVKELTCLVAVGQVLHDFDDPASVCASVVASLVLAMQHPDRAVAIIDLKGQQYSNATATDPPTVSHLMSAPVVVRGQERGRIRLGYRDRDDDMLDEERRLLGAISAMVSLWLERSESAAALAETESWFGRLLRNVPDVIFRFRLGEDGGFDYVSPAVEAMTGYRPEEFLADPRLVERLLSGFGEAAREPGNASYNVDGVAGGVANLVGRDGTQRWVEYKVAMVADEGGEAIEGVVRDVTDRVESDQASQDRVQEQAVLATISESAVTAPSLDALFDTAARLVAQTLPVQGTSVTELSANGEDFLIRGGFGWPDGVVGVDTFAVAGSLAENALGADTPVVVADLAAPGAANAPFIRTNGFVSGIVVRIAGKGGTFGTLGAFSVTAGEYSAEHTAFLQTVAHILGAAVDRWKAEAALSSREREFRTLAESLPDIVARMDPEHRYLYVNPAVASLGVAPEDVIGKTLNEAGLPGELARLLKRAAGDVFASGHEVAVDCTIHDETGDRCLQSRIIPEFDDKSAIPTVVSVTRDISVLRRAEELRHVGLARVVAAQEDERRRIGEDIHDDSIQVMTAVGMRLEGLRRQIENPEAMLTLGRLEHAVCKSVSRLRALMFELRPPELDREGLASALRLYLQETASDRGPQCDVIDGWSADLPVGARSVLYRIALEAITNARKHADATRVEVLLDPAEGGIRMRIRDDGSGFDLTALAEIGPHHVGTTTMRERVEAAGGTLKIQSAPGAGTLVTALLPRTAESMMGVS